MIFNKSIYPIKLFTLQNNQSIISVGYMEQIKYLYYCFTGPHLPMSKKVFDNIEDCIEHCIAIKKMRPEDMSEEQAYKEIRMWRIDAKKCKNIEKVFLNNDKITSPKPKISKNHSKKS